MIRLKNSVFNNVQFMETIGLMFTSDELDAEDSYYIGWLHKELLERSKIFEITRTKLLTQYTQPDEEEEGKHNFLTEEDSKAFEKEFNKLLDVEFELSIGMMPYPKQLKIASSRQRLLEDIFDFTEIREALEAKWQDK